MIHMIDEQIEAYRRAVRDTTRARDLFNTNPHNEHNDSLVSCLEEEQLRLDGLRSVIGMALREYAAREPFSPFNIRLDPDHEATNDAMDALSESMNPVGGE